METTSTDPDACRNLSPSTGSPEGRENQTANADLHFAFSNH